MACKEQLDKVTPYLDYLVGNESEYISWAESHDLKVCLRCCDGYLHTASEMSTCRRRRFPRSHSTYQNCPKQTANARALSLSHKGQIPRSSQSPTRLIAKRSRFARFLFLRLQTQLALGMCSTTSFLQDMILTPHLTTETLLLAASWPVWSRANSSIRA